MSGALAEHQRLEDTVIDLPGIMACFAAIGDTDDLFHLSPAR
ncbi:MAG TPA: hypothetical protein VKP60_11690 [Magnetospirillaceae bacterium]|nr:hypothetical protein [Magnetospirillaceae bacterium]